MPEKEHSRIAHIPFSLRKRSSFWSTSQANLRITQTGIESRGKGSLPGLLGPVGPIQVPGSFEEAAFTLVQFVPGTMPCMSLTPAAQTKTPRRHPAAAPQQESRLGCARLLPGLPKYPKQRPLSQNEVYVVGDTGPMFWVFPGGPCRRHRCHSLRRGGVFCRANQISACGVCVTSWKAACAFLDLKPRPRKHKDLTNHGSAIPPVLAECRMLLFMWSLHPYLHRKRFLSRRSSNRSLAAQTSPTDLQVPSTVYLLSTSLWRIPGTQHP